MHTNIKLFISLTCMLGFFIQCQVPAPIPEKETIDILGEFHVRYLASDQELRGQVTLQRVADTLAVAPEGGVAFMNSGTKQRKFSKQTIRFENTLLMAYTDHAHFSFKLTDTSSPLVIDLPMTGINNFAITDASLNSGLTIDLDGTVKDEESLLLLFTDSNEEARTIVRPGPITSDQLNIPSDALLHFSPGHYRLFMVKSVPIHDTLGSFAYQAHVEYYTQEKSFKLLP